MPLQKKKTTPKGDIMQLNGICRCVFSLGVSPRHKGFAYICRIAEYMLGGGSYRSACARLCRETCVSAGSMERCIRYALHSAWDEHPAAMRSLFPQSAELPKYSPPPALAEFFYALMIRLEEQREREPFAEAHDSCELTAKHVLRTITTG